MRDGTPRRSHVHLPSADSHRWFRRRARCSAIRQRPRCGGCQDRRNGRSADENTAFGHIVEAADEVDERGLGTSGSANDTDRLAGFYGEVNIGEHRLCGCLAVTEGHMVKGDASVRHGFIRIFRIGDVALLI